MNGLRCSPQCPRKAVVDLADAFVFMCLCTPCALEQLFTRPLERMGMCMCSARMYMTRRA